MVAIRRKPRRSANGSMLATARMILLPALVGLYLVRIVLLSSNNSSTIVKKPAGGGNSVESVLHASKEFSNQKPKPNKNQNSNIHPSNRHEDRPPPRKEEKRASFTEKVQGHDELEEERDAQRQHDEQNEKEDGGPPPAPEEEEEDDQENEPDEQLSGHEDEDNNNNERDEATDMVLKKLGSGPTKVGYVADFAWERSHPSFRNQLLDLEDSQHYCTNLERYVLEHLEPSVPNLHACEQLVPETGDPNAPTKATGWTHRLEWHATCHDNDTRFVVYNGAPFVRYVCGKELAPQTAMLVDADCHLWPTVFGEQSPTAPDLSLWPMEYADRNNEKEPSIQVASTPTISTNTKMESIPCDAPCEWEAGLSLAGDRYVVGTPWKLMFAPDRDVTMERTAHRRNEYYATMSWKSSIPLSDFSWDKYNLRNAPALDFDSTENAASSVSNEACFGTPSRRQKWMAAAKSHLDTVHFYGSCEHTTDVPPGMSLSKQEDRLALMKRSRIVLAFEESMESYHVTEIVWEALLSGAVPAILGASNLEADGLLPPHAAIYASSFSTSWDEYAQYIQTVAKNKTLWESYHKWRTNATQLDALERAWNFTRTSPQCRTCRWASAKRYAFGWNAAQQTVQDTHIERNLCTSNDPSLPLIVKPFLESWLVGDEAPVVAAKTESGQLCHGHALSQTNTITQGIERWIWHHSGFTDLTIRSTRTTESLVLRLQVPIWNHEGALFRHVHTTLHPPAVRTAFVSSVAIQDERSKLTVLTNVASTTFVSPQAGWLDVQLQPPMAESTTNDNHPREYKIRIVTEDFNTLTDKLTEYDASAHAQMAMRDFIDPLDVFYVAS